MLVFLSGIVLTVIDLQACEVDSYLFTSGVVIYCPGAVVTECVQALECVSMFKHPW